MQDVRAASVNCMVHALLGTLAEVSPSKPHPRVSKQIGGLTSVIRLSSPGLGRGSLNATVTLYFPSHGDTFLSQ